MPPDCDSDGDEAEETQPGKAKKSDSKRDRYIKHPETGKKRQEQHCRYNEFPTLQSFGCLLESLRLAPTARNQQPIRAWIIKTPERLEDVKKVTQYHYDAPLMIAVGFVAEEAYVRQSDGLNFGIIDVSIAATQLWLRVADMGLGAVWLSDFDTEALKKEFPEFAPAEIVVLMQIGHPAEDSHPIAWHSEKRPAAELLSTL